MTLADPSILLTDVRSSARNLKVSRRSRRRTQSLPHWRSSCRRRVEHSTACCLLRRVRTMLGMGSAARDKVGGALEVLILCMCFRLSIIKDRIQIGSLCEDSLLIHCMFSLQIIFSMKKTSICNRCHSSGQSVIFRPCIYGKKVVYSTFSSAEYIL